MLLRMCVRAPRLPPAICLPCSTLHLSLTVSTVRLPSSTFSSPSFSPLDAELLDGSRASPELEHLCPSWSEHVSTDGATPNRINQYNSATIMGVQRSNATNSKYGCMKDWSLDLGSGYDEDCNVTMDPTCTAEGAHILSIPRNTYLEDCCSRRNRSLAAMVQGGDVLGACNLLHDMIAGALPQIPRLESYQSCSSENQDPVAANQCLAQCFHIRPDVFYLHLHSTAGVKSMRDGPIDSGLGPNYNQTEKDDPTIGHGRYNLCVCEPAAWSDANRGHCPAAAPASADYPVQATESACMNIAGLVGADPGICHGCLSQ